MENAKFKIMNKYGYYQKNGAVMREREMLPEADYINEKLLNAIHKSIIDFNVALEQARRDLSKLHADIEDKLM